MTTVKKKNVRRSFILFLDEQISRLKEENRLGTVKTYSCARKSFVNFAGKDIKLSAINRDLAMDYESWLKKRGVSRNTISFYMRILRSVYNKAVDSGLVKQCYPFVKVYTGVDRTSKRAVGEDIIMRLKSMDLESYTPLSYARDLFVFSFYMRGMAFVDIAYLKKSDKRDNNIQYVRRKTGQMMTLRLEPCMLEIIDKYAPLTKDSEYIFPIITSANDSIAYNQYKNVLSYYNKLLKQLSDLLDLPCPLTSYVSRHTWATTARNRNIPISIISAGMGHTSELTTRIYLDSLDASAIDEANHAILQRFI